ncbi:NAD-dependent deacylase [Aliiroseovarius marinus]|uniref:NAD-dependent deacylase n=1 Tax=Aliiroseovarius marinus TaxID=2500159 RepID=UPI00105E5239|nr:NAD-dependent deacylase [Aliiroseovarius marinus]
MTHILILTGAGISAESGLGTFRDVDGLWTKYDLEDVATPEGFARDPALVHAFYNARRANCLDATPNAAHDALGRLQAQHVGQVTLVTQNVDDLHERGGATDVIHMHGELAGALCAQCDHRWPAPREMSPSAPCPSCNATRTRPDIVWFGEMPYQMDMIYAALGEADLFVAIGTSGTVYPAAGFVGEARAMGIPTLELNLEPSDTAGIFDEARFGPATQIVPAWVDEVLG